jgi:hypothetical protein
MDKVWIAHRDDANNNTGVIICVCATEELALQLLKRHYLYRTYGGYEAELDPNEYRENQPRAKDKLGGAYYVRQYDITTDLEQPD